ncbi:DUF2922 domain-containing protein [Dethiobacter alkaliphilus]|uniref:DUF2922 domain-containing protein n=1 Tax=Dethiobacter alkaliphilus AHT 1 TaxID=555088 RepID=C0GF77_DETAL|nr:DUF2922 domain-containing protein [Dethiobacter alkaliphilus]EEG77837.1 conserved hypothetical protein [Dethiobacter alkaliphilus AHT 1]MCW3488646.1 DUF2922 domain-containing protein [Dethiobacter alkaliphilus]
METTLQLIFRNEEGSLFTINLPFPKEDLTEAQLAAAMDEVIAKNIFRSTGGPLVQKVRVRKTAREVTELVSF